jgi:hypothetical protein
MRTIAIIIEPSGIRVLGALGGQNSILIAMNKKNSIPYVSTDSRQILLLLIAMIT